MATPQDLVGSALTRWRNNLIDLTRRNPLLSLKPNHTSYLEIVQPDLPRVYEHLVLQGKYWSFHFPPETAKTPKKNGAGAEAARTNELVTGESERPVLLKILTNLYRRALADYRERGLHILYVALGLLEWRDEDEEVFHSPIVLVPVKLERRSLQDPFQLTAIDEDPIVNPALASRLKQDFDFRLPATPEDWTDKKPEQYLDDVKAAIAGLPGWEVRSDVILTLFSFFKGVIFQDLQDNADKARSSLVQSLAGVLVPSRIEPLMEHDL